MRPRDSLVSSTARSSKHQQTPELTPPRGKLLIAAAAQRSAQGQGKKSRWNDILELLPIGTMSLSQSQLRSQPPAQEREWIGRPGTPSKTRRPSAVSTFFPLKRNTRRCCNPGPVAATGSCRCPVPECREQGTGRQEHPLCPSPWLRRKVCPPRRAKVGTEQ